MKVRFLIGLLDEDGDVGGFGFILPHDDVFSTRRIPRGREREFATWLFERGIRIDAYADDVDPRVTWRASFQTPELDLPDLIVFEMVNAWSGQR